MGTRADFYVGRGHDAEWLGSIAWDGYPEGIDGKLLRASSERQFRTAVERMLSTRDDGTEPSMGWPWPWDDSGTTDYAYAFDHSRVYASCFGSEWTSTPLVEDAFDDLREDAANFPDMSLRRKFAPPGTSRSGLMVISAPPDHDLKEER